MFSAPGTADGIATEVLSARRERQPHPPSTSGQSRESEVTPQRGARDTGMRLAKAPLADEEVYKPTKEEYRRAIERSGASESQKRYLLGTAPQYTCYPCHGSHYHIRVLSGRRAFFPMSLRRHARLFMSPQFISPFSYIRECQAALPFVVF